MTNASGIVTVTLNPALDKTVTVERFELGALNRIRDMRTDAGGKGINVAKVLKRFGVDAEALGLAAGMQGRTLTEMLRRSGIPHRFVEAEQGETRTNLKIVDESTNRTTELNEPGFEATPALLNDFLRQFEASAGGAAIVVIGGSLPPGAPSDFYKSLIQIANGRGAKVILDADGEALRSGIEAQPYALKPNIHELERLFGERYDDAERLRAAAATLLRGSTRCVLVSMGEQGSLLLHGDDAYLAKPFPITPASTVGAGDSMVAAMAFSFLRGRSGEELARWTSAAGTITASKPGTDVCTLEEVRERLADVDITKL